MKTRTCPHCNYKYSKSEYIKKFLFKFVFSEWNCKNCNKRITFDPKRRVNVALCFGGTYFIIFLIFVELRDKIGMTPLLWIGFPIILFICSVFIFTFDTFKEV